MCFACGGISEAGYRKLGADRRASWKYPQCKVPLASALSPVRTDTATDSASLELVLSELRDMKRQFPSLYLVVDEFK